MLLALLAVGILLTGTSAGASETHVTRLMRQAGGHSSTDGDGLDKASPGEWPWMVALIDANAS